MELAIYFESLGVLTVEQVPEYSFGDIVGKETCHLIFSLIYRVGEGASPVFQPHCCSFPSL